MTELLDALGEMLGLAALVGGVVFGLPAFGLGFLAGWILKGKRLEQSPE